MPYIFYKNLYDYEMKIFNTICQWFAEKRENYHKKQEAKQRVYNELEARENINVTEFDGRIYISYDGIPIVRVEDLKVKPTELLVQARKDYLSWQESSKQ